MVRDPLGDALPGTLDLTNIRFFRNEHALYLTAEFLDPGASFDRFVVFFQTADRLMQIAWSPRWREPTVADLTSGYRPIGDALHSDFSFGPDLEARIDLRDLGSPSQVDLTSLMVRSLGTPDASRVIDSDRLYTKVTTPVVNEIEPAWRLAAFNSASRIERNLSAPDTRAIQIEYDASALRATITGGAGAVPAGARVLVNSLELNDYQVMRADLSGRFTAEVAAAPGSHILIKQDATGEFTHDDLAERITGIEDMIAPGVLIRVPVESTVEGISFGAASRFCLGGCSTETTVPWSITGSYSSDSLNPGDSMSVSAQVTLWADESDPPPFESKFFIQAALLGDADGRQVGRAGRFVSPFLTATGLPIERTHGGPPLGKTGLGNANLFWKFDGEHWIANFKVSVRIPGDMKEGIYSLVTEFPGNFRNETFGPSGLNPFPTRTRDQGGFIATLGTIAVGNPQTMRLATTLLADELSEGTYGGVLAREDRGLFDITSSITTRHDPVIARTDGYGTPRTYRLEPYAPMLDVVDRALPNSPALVLDFQNSELTIIIQRPDEKTDVLGPAPLTRYAMKSPRTPWGTVSSTGGGILREIPQLLGDGETFAYQFPIDGEYVVKIDGHIADRSGRTHLLRGTYDVTVANIFDVETAFLPTTPFEVGDTMPVAVVLKPGFPAEIAYTVTQVAADGESKIATFRGQANENGWWDGDGAGWTFHRDGEYRVDVQACYSDQRGNVWAGKLRFGGIVATPQAPIVAHGRRGSDGLSLIPAPWGFERDYVYRDNVTAGHMHFPYFTGDILWGSNQLNVQREDTRNAGTAVVTHMSFQSLDHSNPLISRAQSQAERVNIYSGIRVAEMVRAGQIPFRTMPEPDRGKSGGHPDDIDLWSYSYSSAQRPGVRVREIIKGDDVGGSYWRFNDAYNAQPGNGRQGDLPGDFKFLYGGAVIRDEVSGVGIYAIYGSAWVLLGNDDPLGSRFMPPYQGAAGGPNGGPLFSVHDREIDMFFVPMGVRPGAVLETGDLFRMSGPIMPTLPSRLDYTVIAPDGSQRTFDVRANAIGYFYDPDDDFVLDQPGLWTVEASVTHDGMTSAGPVETPYPTGGPLTPNGVSFSFVVTDSAIYSLEIQSGLSELTPAEWYSGVNTARFEAVLPLGWSGDEARLTVTMPGIVLIDEMVTTVAGRIAWDLDGEALNRLASNFDYEQGIADTVTVTFFAEGSVAGKPAQAAGTMVTHGARVPQVPPTG